MGGGVRVCVVAEVCQKVWESFYTVSFEYHRVSMRHIVCTNVLVYIYACACVSVCVRYESGENNYVRSKWLCYMSFVLNNG